MATLLVWHGYLLGGTGSNIYSANVVDAWVRAGHEVVLMCQDPHPDRHAFVHEWQRVRAGDVVERRELAPGGVAARREAGRGSCLMVQADIGGLLPVYLLDRYEGFAVKRFVDLSADELERYAQMYGAALAGVLDRHRPQGAVLNHAVMGPPVLRPVFEAAGVPYSVKIHGSELEYCIAEDPRFVEPAQRGLEGAARVLVGSGHIAGRMQELLGAPCADGRVELLPPGVDLDLFRPVTHPDARRELHGALVDLLEQRAAAGRGRGPAADEGLRAALEGPVARLVEALAELGAGYEERDTETGAAAGVAALDPTGAPLLCYVGKLIRQKGVHLLIAALPLVLARVPDARCVIVGFGMLREGLGALVHALGRGDMDAVDELVERVSRLDGPEEPLGHLARFFARLRAEGALEDYLRAAGSLPDRVLFTGQVDHEVLSHLWPLCHASVVPSIAAEAFGMVSAEAAACGCTPVVSHHSGLADVADAIGADYPPELAHLVSFDPEGPDPVGDLASRLVELCALPPQRHAELAQRARATVEREWSWDSIAARIAAPLIERTATDARA